MSRYDLAKDEDNGDISVTPQEPKASALLIHGYGGSGAEMLPLAYGLAGFGVSSVTMDLPGHGLDTGLFDFEASRAAIRDRLDKCGPFGAIIGHSLGARLALLFGLPSVCLSAPMFAAFEGRSTQMARILRVRRVREARPYSGLESVFAALPSKEDHEKALVVYGGDDLATVKDYARRAQQAGADVKMLAHAGHIDILTDPKLPRLAAEWIGKST